MTKTNRTGARTRLDLGVVLLAATAALLVAGCEKKSDDGGAEPETTQTASNDSTSTGSTSTGKAGGSTTPVASSGPKAVPSYWFESDFDAWIGKRWNEIELFQFMRTPPSAMDTGTRYVVFYRRTCEHCEEMFRNDLAPNPDLASKVTAVEVPESETVLRDPDGWAMPPTECELLELPLGANWIMTTPLTVRVEDGVVRCAIEGEHKGCMGLE